MQRKQAKGLFTSQQNKCKFLYRWRRVLAKRKYILDEIIPEGLALCEAVLDKCQRIHKSKLLFTCPFPFHLKLPWHKNLPIHVSTCFYICIPGSFYRWPRDGWWQPVGSDLFEHLCQPTLTDIRSPPNPWKGWHGERKGYDKCSFHQFQCRFHKFPGNKIAQV